MGERRGREIWRRARVRTHRSTARAGKAEWTRQAHSVEREKRVCGATARRLAIRAREIERERGSARVKKTGADRLAPAGRERERERTRERGIAANRRGPPVRRRGRTAWLGLVG
jgi:hypothetical protein